mgnify:CR=1 FL=1
MSDFAVDNLKKKEVKIKYKINRRQYTIGAISFSILLLLSVLIGSFILPDSNIATNINAKNIYK